MKDKKKQLHLDNKEKGKLPLIHHPSEAQGYFQLNYGFKAVFCNPESGWEKGNVECKVGYRRRNFPVPVPRFLNLADYNKQQLLEADHDGDRDHWLMKEYSNIRNEYFRSLLCLVIGIRGDVEMIPFLMKETERLERMYPEETYAQGSILAIQELAFPVF